MRFATFAIFALVAFAFMPCYDVVLAQEIVYDEDNVKLAHKRRHHAHNRTRKSPKDHCSAVDQDDAVICNKPAGGICRNRTCVSACAVRNLHKCNCHHEDDNYCYLCCGGPQNSCRPAHDYQIYQPNGEMWEHDNCHNCRGSAAGLTCDNRDPKRVCHQGKCSATICTGQPDGWSCDARREKICTDGLCENPCARRDKSLMVCPCDEYSEDRCQLCCFDPRTNRCESAYRKYRIADKNNRPIMRSGMKCRIGSMCNKLGTCSGAFNSLSLVLLGLSIIVSQFISIV